LLHWRVGAACHLLLPPGVNDGTMTRSPWPWTPCAAPPCLAVALPPYPRWLIVLESPRHLTFSLVTSSTVHGQLCPTGKKIPMAEKYLRRTCRPTTARARL
jgi:hypothetical protein